MKTYQLFQAIKPLIDAALAAAGVSAVLTQSYQPTQQGTAAVTQVFMQQLTSKRYGWVKRSEVWNVLNQNFDHVESQRMETVFQVGATTVMNQSTVTQLSSSDILDIVASALQSDSSIAALWAAGIGVLRVTDINNPYFLNDKDRFQSSPSFDLTVGHKHDTITSTPNAYPFESDIYPI